MACAELQVPGYEVDGLNFTLVFNFSSVDHRLMQIELAQSTTTSSTWLKDCDAIGNLLTQRYGDPTAASRASTDAETRHVVWELASKTIHLRCGPQHALSVVYARPPVSAAAKL